MSIQLIKEKNLLTAQISTIFLPDQWTALEQLLTNIKSRSNRCLRKSEKSCKRRWLLKNAKNDFKSNPYNAGKTLLDPKCYVNPKVEQEGLAQTNLPFFKNLFQQIVSLLNISFKYYVLGEMHQLLSLM